MRLLQLLLLLGGSVAFAHEPPFTSVWVQPVAPIVGRAAIVPVGLTRDLAPSLDLMVELTPYAGGRGTCLRTSCRDSVLGLIASAGVAFGRPIVSTPAGELGWFVSPKALAAVANETGATPGTGGIHFNPGLSSEIGGGLDFGLELHGKRGGIYVALVAGWQLTAGFNVGYVITLPDDTEAVPPELSPPGQPLRMMTYGTILARGTHLVTGPNLNLLRIGLAF